MMATGNEPLEPQGIEEKLSALLDGELDKDGDADMAKLIAEDEALAGQLGRMRRVDDLVRAAVPLEEEVPAELLARLGLDQPAADVEPLPVRSAEVIPLAEARAARAARTAAARVPFYRRAGFQRIAAQVLLVVGIGTGVVLFSDRTPHTAPAAPDAQYRVLGDAAQPAAGANAIVRFAPGADAAPVLAVARAAGADVVTAPGESGVARLSIAPSRRNAVLERLRAQPGVVMAEPLDGERP